MLNPVEYLYHFTETFDSLKLITTEGFKPSYARETLASGDIMVPMVSFSNILLRDVGEDEVLNYGQYAIGLHRDWGIANHLNPVNYTYDGGLLHTGLIKSYQAIILPAKLEEYKEHFIKLSKAQKGPMSKHVKLEGPPPATIATLDYLSLNYTEELMTIFRDNAKFVADLIFPVLTLTKPYRVKDKEGNEFIAYNDREWRKLYSDLDVLYAGTPAYDDFAGKNKPHFSEDKYRLKFNINDVKVIMAATDPEVQEITRLLMKTYGDAETDKRLSNGSLTIGTQAQLQKQNF